MDPSLSVTCHRTSPLSVPTRHAPLLASVCLVFYDWLMEFSCLWCMNGAAAVST